MKTVAITEWNGLVSPLYDVACRLCIIRPDGKKARFNIKDLSLAGKSELCVVEGVAIIICGAITIDALASLKEREIDVISWMCGSVDAVFDAYRKGEEITAFAMPGYRKTRYRGRRACYCRSRKPE